MDENMNEDRGKLKLRPRSFTRACIVERRLKTQVRKVLAKATDKLNSSEVSFLKQHDHLVSQIHAMREISALRRKLLTERMLERRDENDVLNEKLDTLAEWIRAADSKIVVYSGAGISTSAAIPDYRGPRGRWTLSGTSRRRQPRLSLPEASLALPTLAHMVVAELVQRKSVSHVVSQNVDGLHLRSGIDRERLSELHGNLFVELCPQCVQAVYRTVDTAERSGFHRHKTGRCCRHCGADLQDSIVHFGEKGRVWAEDSVHRWIPAVRAVKEAQLVLCLGSSLAVLRSYPALWPKRVGGKGKCRLVIVNLQWTSKDKIAHLKIHGECDTVMQGLTARLNLRVDRYRPENDPLRSLATPLNEAEQSKVTRSEIQFVPGPALDAERDSS